jgi:hypothetical protein
MSATHIRRQVYELTPADLERFSVWEFALDEEGEQGQDEATVRPYETNGPVDPAVGMFIVRTLVTLADGTQLAGYLSPPVQGEIGLSTLQPAVVVSGGQVSFWCGMFNPPPEHIAKSYALLGKESPAQVFPLRFESDTVLVGGACRRGGARVRDPRGLQEHAHQGDCMTPRRATQVGQKRTLASGGFRAFHQSTRSTNGADPSQDVSDPFTTCMSSSSAGVSSSLRPPSRPRLLVERCARNRPVEWSSVKMSTANRSPSDADHRNQPQSSWPDSTAP